MGRWQERLAWWLAALFAADRAVKLLALEHRFRRNVPPEPAQWPTVSLLQPITRGAGDLARNLRARALMRYPGVMQHLFICDAADAQAQATCNALLLDFPALHGVVITVPSATGVAAKITKLRMALPQATSDVLCCMDDDVAPYPDTLTRLIPYLALPRAGAAFGLPCFTNWDTPWASLLSGFANANMPLSFVALAYLTDPFRITGQVAAFPRATFAAVGGLEGLDAQLDDDFALAQRLAAHGLRAVQAPVVYAIDNPLPTARAFQRQLRRWFVLPRQAMLPHLNLWQQCVAALTGGPVLLVPGILAALALPQGGRGARRALAACLAVFGAAYALTERRYLRGRIPWRRWPLLGVVAVVTPLHAALTLLGRDEIEWRGQRLRVRRDGTFTVIDSSPAQP